MVCLLRAVKAVWMQRAQPLRQTRTCQRRMGQFHSHSLHPCTFKVYTDPVDFYSPYLSRFFTLFWNFLNILRSFSTPRHELISQGTFGHSSLVHVVSTHTHTRLIPIDHLAELVFRLWPQNLLPSSSPPAFKLLGAIQITLKALLNSAWTIWSRNSIQLMVMG